MGFFIAASLLTYHTADPSLNHSTYNEPLNTGGYVGAAVADIALQTLGITCVLLVITPLIWGIKLLFGNPIQHWWLRITTLLIAASLFSGLCGLITPWDSWPMESGLGGALSLLMYQHIGGIFANALFVGLMIATATLTYLLALGLSLREWRIVGQMLRHVAVSISAIVAAVVVHRRLRAADHEDYAHDDDEYEEDEDEGEYEDEYEDEPNWFQRVIARLAFWKREEYDEYEDEDEDEYDNGEEYEDELEEEETYDEIPVQTPRKRTQAARKTAPRIHAEQSSLALGYGDYVPPSLSLLATPSRSRRAGQTQSALQQNAKLLESVLQDFGVKGEITNIRPGPVVTLYELEPSPGTKSSRVIGLSDDIARSMSAVSARIAVIPGRNAIGIELPNSKREMVLLREMLQSEDYKDHKAKLPLALGKDIGGTPFTVDLAKMPHLLVAGTTGSGKSVAINTMILSLAYRLSPAECKFIMIDPKMLELSVYDDIPHLLSPVVTEPGKAVVALKWTVKEMENRYRLMANLGVRNIDNYNKQIREAKAKGRLLTRRVQTGFDPDTGQPTYEEMELEMVELPYIVVIVDEMADLMLVAGKDIESSIQRLAQMARAAGIHLIMATQRPSVDVITGVIKANFPTRISFQVTSRIDSRTILGEQGAEQLLGQGDMLYMAGGGRITRIHGPFVSDNEVETIVEHLKAQGEPQYIHTITESTDEPGMDGEGPEMDELYDQAVAIVTRDRKASTSYIQRCLRIGYNRAANIIDQMERQGIISPANATGKREVLVEEV